eukprot:2592148-Pyramimonas_sp.AAC.1
MTHDTCAGVTWDCSPFGFVKGGLKLFVAVASGKNVRAFEAAGMGVGMLHLGIWSKGTLGGRVCCLKGGSYVTRPSSSCSCSSDQRRAERKGNTFRAAPTLNEAWQLNGT